MPTDFSVTRRYNPRKLKKECNEMSNFTTFEEFIEEVKERVEVRVGCEKKVLVQPILKNNGTVYEGLIILDSILNISPTIYLDQYYHKFCNGVEMEDVVEDIMETYYENKPEEDFNISLFRDYDKAKHNIIMKLVNTEKNKVLLKDIPHRDFYDLSIIYFVTVCSFMADFGTILIHNQHMELWDVTEEELYEAAIENTPNILPHRFEIYDNIGLDKLLVRYSKLNRE